MVTNKLKSQLKKCQEFIFKISLQICAQFTYLQDDNNDSDITQQFKIQKTQPKF